MAVQKVPHAAAEIVVLVGAVDALELVVRIGGRRVNQEIAKQLVIEAQSGRRMEEARRSRDVRGGGVLDGAQALQRDRGELRHVPHEIDARIEATDRAEGCSL